MLGLRHVDIDVLRDLEPRSASTVVCDAAWLGRDSALGDADRLARRHAHGRLDRTVGSHRRSRAESRRRDVPADREGALEVFEDGRVRVGLTGEHDVGELRACPGAGQRSPQVAHPAMEIARGSSRP